MVINQHASTMGPMPILLLIVTIMVFVPILLLIVIIIVFVPILLLIVIIIVFVSLLHLSNYFVLTHTHTLQLYL